MNPGLIVTASDNFQRTNANPIGVPWDWVTINNQFAMQIASNVAESTSGANNFCAAFYNGATFPNNQWSGIIGNFSGVSVHSLMAGVRIDPALGTGYMLQVTQLGTANNASYNLVTLNGQLNGLASILNVNDGLPFFSGDLATLVVQGTLLSIFHNGKFPGGVFAVQPNSSTLFFLDVNGNIQSTPSAVFSAVQHTPLCQVASNSTTIVNITDLRTF